MENPSSLGDIYGMNPGAFMQAQGVLDRQATASQLANDQLAQQTQFAAQDQPFKLAQLGLNNQTAQARLPGIQAESSAAVRKNSNEDLFNPQFIKDTQGKYTSAEIKRHADDMENAGQLLRQSAALVYDSPMGAAAPVKEKLQAAGVWNPAWEKFNAAQLQAILKDSGDQIGDAATKYRTLIGGITAKGDVSKEIAASNNETKLAIAQSRADALKAVQAAKGSSDPKTLEAAMTGAMLHAQKATDPAEKQAFLQAGQAFQQQLEALTRLRGLAPKVGGVDTSQVANLPATQAPSMPAIVQPPAGVAPPSQQAPASNVGLGAARMNVPQGRVLVRDVKTGKIGHIPESQLDDAMKNGYEMIR